MTTWYDYLVLHFYRLSIPRRARTIPRYGQVDYLVVQGPTTVGWQKNSFSPSAGSRVVVSPTRRIYSLLCTSWAYFSVGIRWSADKPALPDGTYCATRSLGRWLAVVVFLLCVGMPLLFYRVRACSSCDQVRFAFPRSRVRQTILLLLYLTVFCSGSLPCLPACAFLWQRNRNKEKKEKHPGKDLSKKHKKKKSNSRVKTPVSRLFSSRLADMPSPVGRCSYFW